MCGIAGFVGEGGQVALGQMLDAMTYRGPDDRGTWNDGQNCFLGQLRLSIVDLADGHQPMISLDGQIVVIFNGEIYNHQTLRSELETLGHQFLAVISLSWLPGHGCQLLAVGSWLSAPGGGVLDLNSLVISYWLSAPGWM